MSSYLLKPVFLLEKTVAGTMDRHHPGSGEVDLEEHVLPCLLPFTLTDTSVLTSPLAWLLRYPAARGMYLQPSCHFPKHTHLACACGHMDCGDVAEALQLSAHAVFSGPGLFFLALFPEGNSLLFKG
jgi:hypothetical protein